MLPPQCRRGSQPFIFPKRRKLNGEVEFYVDFRVVAAVAEMGWFEGLLLDTWSRVELKSAIKLLELRPLGWKGSMNSVRRALKLHSEM